MKLNQSHIVKKLRHLSWKKKVGLSLLLLVMLAYTFCLPKDLFKDAQSTILLDRDNGLLNAKIADDGQWRFPENKDLPDKFKMAIVLYEDEHFLRHPGFNPVSMYRAFKANRRAGKVVQGGSTITQQTIRLSRKNKKRTYWEKAKEIVLASRLELRYSKNEILGLYGSHAPFGGNVVGLDAASWRYYGRDAEFLSWAETATLAVLPNAPGLIHPGRNRQALQEKRDVLLKKLMDKNVIDEQTYQLAILEQLPDKPLDLPRIAPHLIERLHSGSPGELYRSTIDKDLQVKVNSKLKSHWQKWSQNGVHNGAVLVIHIPTREVLAYTGNSPTRAQHGKDVDIITSARSTGSLLKPLLYASMLDAGEMLPHAVLPDIPTIIGDYRPENFDESYRGAVPASEALYRSLNVPSVHSLKRYGVDRFYRDLQSYGLRDIKYGSDHYGLSLILGGGESTLWDMSSAYTSLASTLNHFDDDYGKYYDGEWSEPLLLKDEKFDKGKELNQYPKLSAASIYHMAEALRQVQRPDEQNAWEYFTSAQNIAWKTGTSFGNRDAWAIGFSPEYLVGVWMGNADGEGRPDVSGVNTAAPLLFSVFDQLPRVNWFKEPLQELYPVLTCRNSGYLTGPFCNQVDSSWVGELGTMSASCPYHQQYHVSENGKYRVNLSCETAEIQAASYFVLPPSMEHYYKRNNASYKKVPKLREDCTGEVKTAMSFIYPQENAKLILPKNWKGKKENVVFQLAHRRPNTDVHWYLNQRYVGSTNEIHEIEIDPSPGQYLLSVVDDYGSEIQTYLEVQ